MKKGLCITSCAALFICFNALDKQEWTFPDYFPKPLYELPSSVVDEQRVALGRSLFFDPILSRDSTISCASCHSPFHAFAHTDHALSHGIDDRIGKRNAPALFNLAWQKHFMWDGAINHLDVQAISPLTHADEMGETMAGVMKKIEQHPYYSEAFEQCWPNEELESYHLLRAVGLFQSTLISQNSRYDEMRKGLVVFNEMESKGYSLFIQHCNSCHTEPLFMSVEFQNNGLLPNSMRPDFGRGLLLNDSTAFGLFKVPSLRNWVYSKPYMHDGRFSRMSEVLHHYSEGPFNDWPSNSDFKQGLNLSSNQKTELMAFLKTLNDSAFVFDHGQQLYKDFFKQPKE